MVNLFHVLFKMLSIRLIHLQALLKKYQSRLLWIKYKRQKIYKQPLPLCQLWGKNPEPIDKWLFLGARFFLIISTDLNLVKILRIFSAHKQKKEIRIFWGHWVPTVHIWVFFGNSKMQIRKKWLNQFKQKFTTRFRKIIWHLFASKSHQVVKITNRPIWYQEILGLRKVHDW